MGAYQFRIWAAASIAFMACARSRSRGGVAADAAPAGGSGAALELGEVWVAGESARDLPRFRPGEALVVGFTAAAAQVSGELTARVEVVGPAGVVVEASASAPVPDGGGGGDGGGGDGGGGGGGGRAASLLAVTLPETAPAGAATLRLEVRDGAGRVGRAELPLTVVTAPPAEVTATGVLAGARLVDAHLRPVGFGMPGQLLALLPPDRAPAGTRYEMTFYVVPPDGTQPTAAMGPPTVREGRDLSFEVPQSVSPLYALLVRARDRGGAVLGSARVRFSGDLPDDERDHLSALRLTRLTIRAGAGRRAVRAGRLHAGESLLLSARVGGYQVAGRRGDGGATFAIGLTMAVRLRDRAGVLVSERERLAESAGPVVTAPPRMVLAADWVVPPAARGRMMLEVEVEDSIAGNVSSVFREVEVVP